MGIFSKKRKPSSFGDVSDAFVREDGGVELIAFDGGAGALVLGLSWRSIVSKGVEASAIKMARQNKATHLIVREQQVGWAKLPKSATLPPRMYPVSAVAARQHVGDSLYVLDLGDIKPGLFWVATSRDGSPTANDEVLRDVDAHEALAQARLLMEQVEDGASSLTVYTNVEHHGFTNAQPISLQGLIDAAKVSDQMMRPVASQSSKGKNKPLLVGAVLLMLAIAGNEAWNQHKESELARLALLNKKPAIDPALEWGKVIEQWQRDTAAPRPTTLTDVIASAYKAPVNWEGWSMSVSSCNAGALSGGTPIATQTTQGMDASQVAGLVTDATTATIRQSWSCSATYERKPNGTLSRDMAPKIPGAFSVSFTPLNQMVLSWSFFVDAENISLEKIQSVQHHNIESSSHLQHLQQAMVEEPRFTFAPVTLIAPKAEDGTALPPDPRIADLKSGELQVRGPLRTLEAIGASGIQVAWRSISIQPDTQTNTPGLRSSVLMAQAQGVLYANK